MIGKKSFWKVEAQKVTVEEAKKYLGKKFFCTLIDEEGSLFDLSREEIRSLEEKDVVGWTLTQDEEGFKTQKRLVLTDGKKNYIS